MFALVFFFLFSYFSRNVFLPIQLLKAHPVPLGRVFSLRGQLHWLEDTNRNVLDLTVFQNQIHYRKFSKKQDFHIHFGSSQPPVFSKTTTVASLVREQAVITPTNSLKKDLSYSSDILKLIICGYLLTRRYLLFRITIGLIGVSVSQYIAHPSFQLYFYNLNYCLI